MALVSIAFENIIPNGIAAQTNQQANKYLWILMFTILGETCFTKIIFI